MAVVEWSAGTGEVTVEATGADFDALFVSGYPRLVRTVGFVWQQTARNLLPYLSAFDNVLLPMTLAGVPADRAQQRADDVLALVGLRTRRDHRPDQLSGGEEQRVALARALAGDPEVVLADEPTGELDSVTTTEMLALIGARHRNLGTTFVIATHDPLLASIATRVVRLRDGWVEATP